MYVGTRKKIVILGMMSKMPVAGNAWLVAHYMVGLRRLGFEPYYVEAHGITPAGMLLRHPDDDGAERAAAYVAGVMERFDLNGHWAYQALHADGRTYGLTEGELARLYRSAELIVNLHGGTVPLEEHSATGRLVYLGTDPVQLEIEVYEGRSETIDFLCRHSAFFTWGLNYGNPDCGVPASDRFDFKPSRPPVVPDFWLSANPPAGRRFTTVGNWRQDQRTLTFEGETYHWSKHLEFLKFIDLPERSRREFELALSGSSIGAADRRLLERYGWCVRDALEFSTDLDRYRDYLQGSRGEFTVAKDQNVRLRSGWFSERSAQYLAAGRPVITQDTGFGAALPTGRGLFAFSTMDELLEAVEAVEGAYGYHCRAAAQVARECFHYEVVLREFLAEFGLNPRRWRAPARAPAAAGETNGHAPGSNGNGKAGPPATPHFAARLGEAFGATPEPQAHPHVTEERAHLFRAADASSTELEILNLLHALVLAFKPETALETGTHRGLGAIAIASALEANGTGTLHTVELDPGYVALARDNINHFDPTLAGRVELHHADSLRFVREHEGPAFDFAFFDSAMANRHREFEALELRGMLAPGAVCVFHDTSPYRSAYWHDDNDSEEMRRTVAALTERLGGLVSRLSRGFTVVQLPPAPPRLTQPPLAADACQIRVAADLPAEVRSGEVVEVACEIKNAGPVPLASEAPNPVCVSYRWLGPGGVREGGRTALPEPLAPGATIGVPLRLVAPGETGEYTLRLTLVQEHVRWFDDVDGANGVTATVAVEAATARAEDESSVVFETVVDDWAASVEGGLP